jgi:SAM-dependent methyltransferase
MEKNYYKEYYHLEREHWWFKARAEIILSHLRKVVGDRRDLRILNVGVATGHSSELLGEFGEVESVEYDVACFEFVRDVVKIPVVNASILELPYQAGTFDLVCAFDVIEHVKEDELAVSEMFRVCKTGGVMCVTVPSFMFLWSEHDVVNHHFRRYTGRVLTDTIQKNLDERKLIYQSYFNTWLFLPIAAFRILANLLTRPKKIKDDETGSDFGVLKGGLIGKILYYIFRSETWFIKRFISLPFGVSLISTWRKIK